MSRASHFRRRRGQALIEFALIALVLAVMLGAMLSLGHMFFAAQTIQQAVDVAAQEIARTPFPAASELGLGSFVAVPNSVMETALFKEQIFDERHLVIDPDDPDDLKEYVPCNQQVVLSEIAQRLPLLNRLLVTAMIHDTTYDPPYQTCDPRERGSFPGVFRYPGAIVTYATPSSVDGMTETVLIPIVGDRDGPPYEETVLEWRRPVEEMTYEGVGPFSISATVPLASPANPSFQPGMVALRINYPFQAAGLVKYVVAGPQLNASGTIMMDRVDASDRSIDAQGPASVPGIYSLAVQSDSDSFDAQGNPRVNTGKYGLGRLAAYKPSAGSLGVRPYRRVISAQAIYRREVFE